MKFNYTIGVNTNFEDTWTKLQDSISVVHCIPGVEEVKEGAKGQYEALVVTKLGPISLRFRGNAELVVKDEERIMEATVSMSDSKTGNVYGKFSMALVPDADKEGTTLQIDADLVIAGKLGELAQPLIKRKADQIVKEFSLNLTKYLQSE